MKALRIIRRKLYDLRAYVPGLKHHHRMEKMVGPVGYWKELEAYQLHALCTHGLEPQHALLDLGCGPLQGGVALIRHLEPAKYTGVDIAPAHLDAAHFQISRHGLAAKNPRLIHSRTFGDEMLDGSQFDFMWASQVLYYFDREKLAHLFEFSRRRLRPGGRFLGDFINPDHFDAIFYPRCGFIRHSVADIQEVAAAQGLRARVLGRLEQFRYPKRLTLRSSLLVEFMHQ